MSNSRLHISKRNTTSAISHSSSASKEVKLRMIMKRRGSQHEPFDEEYQLSQSRTSNRSKLGESPNQKINISLNLHELASQRSLHNRHQSGSRIILQKVENCEQELLGKQDFDFMYKQVYQKLDELESEAERLIRKKIRKIAQKPDLITLKSMGKDETTYQIEELVRRIQMIDFREMEKFSKGKEKVRELMDWKIQILEKLIAENEAESEALKRYFFAISAINSKERSQPKVESRQRLTSKTDKFYLTPIHTRTRTQAKQTICKQSSNKMSYNPPQPQDYETYRHKKKEYQANLQPLPRSSYNSEYLFYSIKHRQPACKTMDSYTIFGKSRLKSSTYEKDYQPTRTEVINYRELDSYQNKFKNLEVSFSRKNSQKETDLEFMERSRSYIADQPRLYALNRTEKKAAMYPTSTQKQLLMRSEAKSQFIGEQRQIHNGIKNKRLNYLKYTYKTLVNE